MPYIRRSPEGKISALLAEPETDAQEYLPADAPEVCSFLSVPHNTKFTGLDADFIRVLEDLIDVLTDKNLIRITDLPHGAQRKLLLRKDMRRKLRSSLNILDDNDVI